MNNIISYSIIIILSLVSIIALGNINKIEQKIKLKGTKIVLFFIILMSYMTLISDPVKQILNNYITLIKLPKGNKGSRGNRGGSGSSAICETCGDDLCLKKILFNITNTYNYWRQLNGLKIYPDTYVIKNEYLKDKIIKHCKSTEFQKIIKKYGSNNNKDCPDNLKDYDCGAYDYMFKMWSIWILVILKYKNGIFFLESDSLTDVDFDGLIDKDDCFLQGDIVTYNSQEYIIDKSTDSKRIHPMYHIYEQNTSSNKTIVHISQLKLKDSSENPNYLWKQMFTYSNGNDGLKIKRIKRIISNNTVTTPIIDAVKFSAVGVNEDFMKKNGLPSRGKLSPFDEIKKYDAWYWGRDEKLKPEIIITKPFVSDFEKTCPNPKGKIKFIKTNKYYELFTSKNKKYNKSIQGTTITIDEILGEFNGSDNEDIVFLRPSKFVDTNEHGYFKEYKPIGDIIIKESERLLQSNSNRYLNCEPDLKNKLDGYTNVIGKKITNKDKDTYLVSGDTKSPVNFELKWHYKKTHGINKGYVGLSIWKPIAPNGYIAMGYVVDQRYYDGGGEPPKPNFDSIACVPEGLTSVNTSPYTSSSTENWTPINSEFFTKPSNNNAHYYDINTTIQILRNKNTNTFATSDDLTTDTNLDKKINEDSNLICKGNNANICDNNKIESECNEPNCVWDKEKCSIKQQKPKIPRTSIKDKKFSILKLYE